MWLLAGPGKCNWPSVTFQLVFQNPVTINVEHFDKVKEEFLLEVKTIVAMDEIPQDLIINFNQTALNYVPATPWTMEQQGTKRIEVIGKGDKWQITAVFGGIMTGDFLPLQLIYEGKTERCLPRYKFPTSRHMTQSESHWSNEITMKQYIEKFILPYINRKREELQFPNDQPALLIFDLRQLPPSLNCWIVTILT